MTKWETISLPLSPWVFNPSLTLCLIKSVQLFAKATPGEAKEFPDA